MKVQHDDRASFWEQPRPRRDGGFTWVIIRLIRGNPEVVVETTVGDLADTLREALDGRALDDLVTRLEARFPEPDAMRAMHDLDLINLIDETEDMLKTATRILRERHTGDCGSRPTRTGLEPA